MGPKSLTLTPNPVTGGSSVTGTVLLPCPAGPADVVVSLASTKPSAAQPAAPTVTVLHDAKSSTFTVNTSAATAVAKPAIKSTAGGVTKSKTLTVNPGNLGSLCPGARISIPSRASPVWRRGLCGLSSPG